MGSCRRTLQQETTEPGDKELDHSSYTKTKLDAPAPPDGLISFFDNLAVNPSSANTAYDCEYETAFDFQVSSTTYPAGIDLSYLVFQYFYQGTIPDRPHIFNIYIYNDTNGKPGTLLDHRIGMEAINEADAICCVPSGGLEEITLDCPISLLPGLYWISIHGQVTGRGYLGMSSTNAFSHSREVRISSNVGSWVTLSREIRVALYGTVHAGPAITFPTELYLNESQTFCTDIKCVQSICIEETDTIIPNDNFCDDDKICTKDICNVTDGCIHIDECEQTDECLECNPSDPSSDPSTGCKAKADGNTICDDGLEFTLDICVAEEGGCIHINKNAVCPDKCLEWDPNTGCKAKSNGDQICYDANECTIDTCENDIGCQYSPIVCEDDGVDCTYATCDVFTGCIHTPNPELCNDNLECTIGICDLHNGCVSLPIANCKKTMENSDSEE